MEQLRNTLIYLFYSALQMEPWIFVFEKNCAYKKLLIKKNPESIFVNAFKVYRFVASLLKKNNNSYCNVKSVSIKKASSIAETRSEKWMILD